MPYFEDTTKRSKTREPKRREIPSGLETIGRIIVALGAVFILLQNLR